MNNYTTKRETVINSLSEEMEYLTGELEKLRETGEETKEYRALLKSYTDAAKLHLRLIKEAETESRTVTDELAAFVGDAP